MNAKEYSEAEYQYLLECVLRNYLLSFDFTAELEKTIQEEEPFKVIPPTKDQIIALKLDLSKIVFEDLLREVAKVTSEAPFIEVIDGELYPIEKDTE